MKTQSLENLSGTRKADQTFGLYTDATLASGGGFRNCYFHAPVFAVDAEFVDCVFEKKVIGIKCCFDNCQGTIDGVDNECIYIDDEFSASGERE